MLLLADNLLFVFITRESFELTDPTQLEKACVDLDELLKNLDLNQNSVCLEKWKNGALHVSIGQLVLLLCCACNS